MRLIDADKLIETLGVAKDCDDCPYSAYGFCGKSSDFVNACEAITDAPTVEPQRIKGRWVGTDYDGFADGNPVYDEWKCSICGCVVEDEEPTWNFCPFCGSDMRGD